MFSKYSDEYVIGFEFPESELPMLFPRWIKKIFVSEYAHPRPADVMLEVENILLSPCGIIQELALQGYILWRTHLKYAQCPGTLGNVRLRFCFKKMNQQLHNAETETATRLFTALCTQHWQKMRLMRHKGRYADLPDWYYILFEDFRVCDPALKFSKPNRWGIAKAA